MTNTTKKIKISAFVASAYAVVSMRATYILNNSLFFLQTELRETIARASTVSCGGLHAGAHKYLLNFRQR